MSGCPPRLRVHFRWPRVSSRIASTPEPDLPIHALAPLRPVHRPDGLLGEVRGLPPRKLGRETTRREPDPPPRRQESRFVVGISFPCTSESSWRFAYCSVWPHHGLGRKIVKRPSCRYAP